MWISKPTGLNQGKGIFLLKSQEDISAFRLKLQHMEGSQESRKLQHRQPQARIVQQWVNIIQINVRVAFFMSIPQ